VAATVVAGVGLLGVVLTAAGVVLVASCDVALGDTALAGESTGTRYRDEAMMVAHEGGVVDDRELGRSGNGVGRRGRGEPGAGGRRGGV